MDKLKPQQLISLSVGALIGWSALMFVVGLHWDEADCSTCEEALSEQTKQYQACELDLFECSQAACEEVAALERERCQDYVSSIQDLRCRICEKINGSTTPLIYSPHPQPSQLTDSDQGAP
jgi:hypothetical protein